jgi:very-short-patch-repair endonuclease
VRTLCDLAAVVHPGRLEHAVDGALRDGLTDDTEIAWFLRRIRRKGRAGVRPLERLLAARGLVVPQSVLERAFLRLVENADVDAPVGQFRIARPDGRDAFVDFAFPQHRIAIEVDGHTSHATRAQRAADSQRMNQLALAGWTVLRFTYEDVTQRGPYVLGAIRAASAASRVVA